MVRLLRIRRCIFPVYIHKYTLTGSTPGSVVVVGGLNTTSEVNTTDYRCTLGMYIRCIHLNLKDHQCNFKLKLCNSN